MIILIYPMCFDNFMIQSKTKMKKPNSRRSFLQHTALTAAGFMIVPRFVLGGEGISPQVISSILLLSVPVDEGPTMWMN